MFPLTDGVRQITGVHRPGTGALPTLVLLHGIQGTAGSWAPVLERLPPHLAVVAPNLRGRGGSSAPEDPEAYPLSAFASDLALVLDSIDGPLVLAGWSMGVVVALAYLRAHQDKRLRGLALISGTATPGRPGAVWFEGQTADAIRAESDARARRLGLVECASSSAVAGAWLGCRGINLLDVLPTIDCPMVILHGDDDDQCAPAHAEAMASVAPAAHLTIIPGGHNLLAESPDAVARALEALAGA